MQSAADDRGPVLGICSVFFIVFALISYLGRIFTKHLVVGNLTRDDLALSVGMLLAIGQSVLTIVAEQNGLGRHASATPTQPHHETLDKITYAADLLFIAAITSIKLAATMSIYTVLPFDHALLVAWICGTMTVLWGVASVLGDALICNANASWLVNASACSEQGFEFWSAFDALNLLSEVFLICWPLWCMRLLDTTWKIRLFVALCFSAKIVPVAAIITQLVYLHRLSNTADRVSAVWPLVITTQAVQSMSIAAVCIPSLRPFFANTESGMFRSDDVRRRGLEGSTYGYGSTAGSRGGSVATLTPVRRVSGIVGSIFGRKGSESTTIAPPPRALHLDHESQIYLRSHHWGKSSSGSSTTSSDVV